ncbi:hypothetical protein NXS19_004286 [Fusarium pseudograminearum]|nr:hypothetical protein NXS19_004286 [Fusarium pseudograminearum]
MEVYVRTPCSHLTTCVIVRCPHHTQLGYFWRVHSALNKKLTDSLSSNIGVAVRHMSLPVTCLILRRGLSHICHWVKVEHFLQPIYPSQIPEMARGPAPAGPEDPGLPLDSPPSDDGRSVRDLQPAHRQRHKQRCNSLYQQDSGLMRDIQTLEKHRRMIK